MSELSYIQNNAIVICALSFYYLIMIVSVGSQEVDRKRVWSLKDWLHGAEDVFNSYGSMMILIWFRYSTFVNICQPHWGQGNS